jgi:hypothetical protein
MNLFLIFVTLSTWQRLFFGIVLVFLMGYCTRVVLEHFKSMRKEHKKMQRRLTIAAQILNEEANAHPGSPPDTRRKIVIARSILKAELRADHLNKQLSEPLTDPHHAARLIDAIDKAVGPEA